MVGSVNMRQLGDVGPHAKADPASRSSVDAAPIVLWSATGPAAVLRYELESSEVTNRVDQRLVRIDGGSGGPFPIELADSTPPGTNTEDALELWAYNGILTADLDGDGVDELVLIRSLGAAEAHGVEKTLFKTTWFAPRTRQAGHTLKSTFLARAGDRDVILALFERKLFGEVSEAQLAKDGLGDRFLLARIDQSGARRIQLRFDAYRPEMVLAVGALNLPGSSGLDELLVLSRPEGREPLAFLSRHAPDGRLLAPPRQIYVPFDDSAQTHFESIPQSNRTVAFEGGRNRAYFLSPQKPANWVRMVELGKLAPVTKMKAFLGVVDAQANPKCVARIDDAVFAFDEEGTTFLPEGAGWRATGKPEPFYRVHAPSPKHSLHRVYRSRQAPDSFLVVHDRAGATTELTEQELNAAAERFVRPEVLAKWKRSLEPSLEREDANRDDWIDQERGAKGLDRPKSVEEWRRTLPSSYERWTSNARSNFQIRLAGELTRTRVEPNPDAFQRFDDFLAWRRAQSTPGETLLTWVRRGATVATLRIPAPRATGPSGTSLVLPWVDARLASGRLTAVLALARGEAGKEVYGFYAVTEP